MIRLTPAEAVLQLSAPGRADEIGVAHGVPVVMVHGKSEEDWEAVARATPAGKCVIDAPAVIVAVDPDGVVGAERETASAAMADLVVADDEDGDLVAGAVCRHPLASLVLAQLLRSTLSLSVGQALTAESVAYGLLQGGPEFAAWRRSHPPAPVEGSAPAVVTERQGGRVIIELARPRRHNALDRQMRDELVDALVAVEADPAVEEVVLRGRGPTFCAGGDLAEFGTFEDPVSAHGVRSTRLPARAVAACAARLRVEAHGRCAGAGVELGALAGEFAAAAGTTFRLPEVGMGLIPGSGGTVGIPRRIGRHRTAYLALSGEEIDLSTAREWGLVDKP